MGHRYDTVMQLHARVRDELETIATDPRFRDPSAVLKRLDVIISDEFDVLGAHEATLGPRDLANILDGSHRIRVYAQLLTMRATSFAAKGNLEASAMHARRALGLYVEDALRCGDFALDVDDVEHLRRMMGDATLGPSHEDALRTLLSERLG